MGEERDELRLRTEIGRLMLAFLLGGFCKMESSDVTGMLRKRKCSLAGLGKVVLSSGFLQAVSLPIQVYGFVFLCLLTGRCF